MTKVVSDSTVLNRPAKGHIRTLLSLTVGFLFSQILSTGMVYLSDIRLYEKLVAIQEVGFLPIPNRHIMPSLTMLKPAFFGGLFFTVTVGMFLTILTYLTVALRNQIQIRRKLFDAVIIILWGICLWIINKDRVCLEGTLYIILIPLSVAITTIWAKKPQRVEACSKKTIGMMCLYGLFLAGCAGIVSQSTLRIFSGFRDYFLLSHPAGQFANEFYYQYTLYSAEVFKSQKQKQLKTSCLEGVTDDYLKKQIEYSLIQFDYLPISRRAPCDLTLHQNGNQLKFFDRNKLILTEDTQSFLKNPKEIISNFSYKTDRFVKFRQLTFAALVINLSLVLYLMILIPAVIVHRLIFKSAKPALFICAVVSGMLLSGFGIYRYLGYAEVDVKDPAHALTSTDWKTRLAGLEIIWKQKQDITQFENWTLLMSSPHIPERYWLAKALGISRSPEAHLSVVKLLDDPNFNVVYAAFESLGKQGGRSSIDIILKRIQESDHWYTQWYAYRSLKQMGWHQKKTGVR